MRFWPQWIAADIGCFFDMSDIECLDEPQTAAKGVQVANHLDTNAGRPLPHLSGDGRLDAMNPDPDYSAAYVELITDLDSPADRQRFRLHHRPRQRCRSGRDQGGGRR